MAEDTNENIVEFKLPQDEDVTVTLDVGDFHAKTVARLLGTAAANYVRNAVNGAHQRWQKAGSKANEKPDYAEVAGKAKQRLIDGDIAAKAGEGKAKKTKDPVDAIVTETVKRELFGKRQAKNPKTKWTDIVAEVGASGIEYLTKKANGDADKLKMIETKYLKPARGMLGLDAKGNPKPAASDEDDGDSLL